MLTTCLPRYTAARAAAFAKCDTAYAAAGPDDIAAHRRALDTLKLELEAADAVHMGPKLGGKWGE